METYLVTGGSGFIGSNYIKYMLEKYKESIRIINLDLLTYAGNAENLKEVENNENYKFIKANICDKETVKNIFNTYDIDYVVNFAAESHVDRSIKNPEVFVQTNVLGTITLLNEAKNSWQNLNGFKDNKKFIHISTDEVYGSLGEVGYFTETTSLDPHSPYSASKASSDMLVKSYYDTYKMPVNITRCSNNYGPYQFPEKLIPLMINNTLADKELPIYGDGKNIRDWLYVEDHVIAIDMVTQKGNIGEIYNIGGHNEKQNIEIVNIILDELNKPKSLIKYVEDRKGHDRRYAINSDKIKEELGWTPQTNFKEGIKKTIKWYLDNLQWMKKVTTGEYQNYYKQMYCKDKQTERM